MGVGDCADLYQFKGTQCSSSATFLDQIFIMCDSYVIPYFVIFVTSLFLSFYVCFCFLRGFNSKMVSISACVIQRVVVSSVPSCVLLLLTCLCTLSNDGLTTYRGWPTSPFLPICINHSLDLTVTRQHGQGDAQPLCRNEATNPEKGRPACLPEWQMCLWPTYSNRLTLCELLVCERMSASVCKRMGTSLYDMT